MKKQIVVILGILFVFMAVVKAQPAKIQSAFIYNFTKYIEWPAAAKSGDFVIAIVGSGDMVSELKNLAATKKAGNQTIKVVTVNSASEIPKCNICYITDAKSGELGGAVSKLSGSNTLIITNKPGTAKQGAVINMTVKDGKPCFELNKANASKYGLKVSPALEKLAIVVG